MRSWERAHEKRLHGDLSTKAQRWRELGLEGEEQNGWVCDAPAVQRGSAQAGRQAGSAACTKPSPEPHEDLLGCPPTLGCGRILGIALCLFSGDLFWLAVVLQHLTTPQLRAGRSCGCRKWPRTYLAGQICPRTPFNRSSVLQPKTGWIIPNHDLCCLKIPCGKGEAGRRQPEEGTQPWAELPRSPVAKVVYSPHLRLVGDVDLRRGHTGHRYLGPWPQTNVQVWKMPGTSRLGVLLSFLPEVPCVICLASSCFHATSSLGELHV